MSMLAEPRRKTKWTLNPRGKIWTDDETKLGQKLLEKMGWSKGKGLGRKEQGDLEPIRLNYKSDSKGMGFKGSDDDWVQHRDEFNALLSQLNGSDTVVEEEDISLAANGLERRSKTSRARVHYHKFVRNKDLSKYSAEDLACILGKRQNTKVETPQDSEQDDKEEDRTESDENEERHTHGVTTIKRGNIHEYFAAKLAALQQKTGKDEDEEQARDTKRRKSVTINEEMNLVKEFCSTRTVVEEFSNDSWAVEQSEEVVYEVKTKSKKKKRKTEAEHTAEQLNTIPEDLVSEEIAEPVEEGRKKKKKKPRKDDMDCVSDVAALYDDVQPSNDDVETGTEKKKKKKKKQLGEEEVRVTSTQDAELITEPARGETKKKKKKKVHEEADCLPSESSSATEDTPQCDETNASAKDKKKKKKKRESDATSTEVETSLTEAAPTEPEVSEPAAEKKKRKKKIKQDDQSAETVDVRETEILQTEAAPKASGKRKRQTERSQDADVKGTESHNGELELAPQKKRKKGSVAVLEDEINIQAEKKQELVNGHVNRQSGDLSNKFKRKFLEAKFDQFSGSNILEVKGYAYA